MSRSEGPAGAGQGAAQFGVAGSISGSLHVCAPGPTVVR